MIYNSADISVYCDGGSRGNPGPSACAFVIKDHFNKTIKEDGKFLGTATNNIAEYNGALLALTWLKANINSFFPEKKLDYQNKMNINFYLDSILVASQLSGLFKIKNFVLKNLFLQIKTLENQISFPIVYHQIPRAQNFEADLLVNKVLDRISSK